VDPRAGRARAARRAHGPLAAAGIRLDPGVVLAGDRAEIEGGVRLRRADTVPSGALDAGASVLYDLPYELLDAPPAWRDLVARFPRETLAAPPPSLPAATRRATRASCCARLDPSLRVSPGPDLGPVEAQHGDGSSACTRSSRARRDRGARAVRARAERAAQVDAAQRRRTSSPRSPRAEDAAGRHPDVRGRSKRAGCPRARPPRTTPSASWTRRSAWEPVDQVLDLASLDRGVATFAPLPGDLGAAVRDAAAMCLPAAKEVGVPVAVDVEAGLPTVRFDGALVRPIVLNLVDNAVKYSARSPTKDVRVSVRRDGDRVALVVADRGVGIPAADRRRVFEPFFRSGREETRTTREVGLGSRS
jgi:hypothetical protein